MVSDVEKRTIVDCLQAAQTCAAGSPEIAAGTWMVKEKGRRPRSSLGLRPFRIKDQGHLVNRELGS